MKAYKASKHAQENPMRVFIGEIEVGVGAAIKIVPDPPSLPYVVREATPEEYEILFHRGHKTMIDEYDDNKQGRKA